MDELTPCSTPLRGSRSSTPARHPDTGSTCPTERSITLNADYIRDAALCMLRRQEGNNIPAMSRYLSDYFSEIPEDFHMPIIVATFSAAQKVAATHVDTLLPGDDERICWARRSLARWTHGLSGVEKRMPTPTSDVGTPSYVSGDSRKSTPPTSSLVRAETNVGDRATDLATEHEVSSNVGRSSSSEQGLTRGLTRVGSVVGGAEVPVASTEPEVVPSQSVDSSLEPSEMIDVSSNVFTSRSLPVPMESAFAQADVNAVLKEVVTRTVTSESRSIFDDGPDGVLVSDAEPNVDSFLQQDSSSVPLSLDDLLNDSGCETLQCHLLRPLSVVVTPLSTPRVDRANVEDVNPDPVINLFPSPHPSFEEDAGVPQDVRISPTSIKERRLKDIRIVRKGPGQGSAEKENVLSTSKEKSKTTSNSAQSNSASSTAHSDGPAQRKKSEGNQRPKSTVSSEFRIPIRPRNQSNSGSERRDGSPRPGEKRRREDPFGRDQRYDKHAKPAFQHSGRGRFNSRGGWHAPPRPFVHPAEIPHSRLTPRQLEWLDRMPHRWN